MDTRTDNDGRTRAQSAELTLGCRTRTFEPIDHAGIISDEINALESYSELHCFAAAAALKQLLVNWQDVQREGHDLSAITSPVGGDIEETIRYLRQFASDLTL